MLSERFLRYMEPKYLSEIWKIYTVTLMSMNEYALVKGKILNENFSSEFKIEILLGTLGSDPIFSGSGSTTTAINRNSVLIFK